MSEAGRSTRRLFVALRLPEPALIHLRDEVDRVRRHDPEPTGPGRLRSAVRWADPASWHLTLVFCASVMPPQASCFIDELGSAAARHPALRLSIAGGGRFGHRVLWAGVAGDRSALVAVAGSATDAARAAGIAVEDRPYRPHLTIARGRPGADLTPAAVALGGYTGPAWPADELVLVESALGAGPGGTARHVVVQAFPLG